MIEKKVSDIRSAFGPAIGSTLSGYSTAEVLHDDETWDAWPDLPIRLEWGAHGLIAVSWSKFDDLWIAMDTCLPFTVDGSKVRWVRNALEAVNRAVGATIRSVALGRGEMSVEGRDVEVWTRLLIQTDSGWLEIFNALDENGCAFHPNRPVGTLVSCI